MNVLGIGGAFGHDAACCLVADGTLIAAAEEERFTRVKHAPGSSAIRSAHFCLHQSGLSIEDIDVIAVSWNPALRRDDDALLNAVHAFVNHESWHHRRRPAIEYVDHHVAHAAASFFCSGFSEATVLVVDGNGEETSTTIAHARGNSIQVVRQFGFGDSLGQFYKSVTEHIGLGSQGEGKTMGLSAYGRPRFDIPVIDLTADGYHVNLPYPSMAGLENRSTIRKSAWRAWLSDTVGPATTVVWEWSGDKGCVTRDPRLTERDADLAASAQSVLVQTLLHLVKVATEQTGSRNLVMGGGVALNCGANGTILRSDLVDNLYVFPAAHDAGGAVGAALYICAQSGYQPSTVIDTAAWGPEFSSAQIFSELRRLDIDFVEPDDLAAHAVKALSRDRVIGFFQGRMEIGPRALGQRSILAAPHEVLIRDRVNHIKGREPWRPLSPVILREDINTHIVDPRKSPFMLHFAQLTERGKHLLPGVSHIDGSCRPQIVEPNDHSLYRQVLVEWHATSGIPALINTSFNLNAEPIVCSPIDAVRSFFSSELDDVLIGPFAISKHSD